MTAVPMTFSLLLSLPFKSQRPAKFECFPNRRPFKSTRTAQEEGERPQQLRRFDPWSGGERSRVSSFRREEKGEAARIYLHNLFATASCHNSIQRLRREMATLSNGRGWWFIAVTGEREREKEWEKNERLKNEKQKERPWQAIQKEEEEEKKLKHDTAFFLCLNL